MKHRHSVILLLLSTIILLLSTCNKTGFDNDTELFDEALQSSDTLSAEVIKRDIFDLEYGEIAYKYLEYIQDTLPGRVARTKKERETAAFIVRTLLDIGYSTDSIQIQPFNSGRRTYNQDWIFSGGEEIENSQNIIVTKKGGSDKVIVIGAHYDSVGTHGVVDNGSGISILLESALRLFDKETPYTLRFIFFGHEETTADGSNYYVDSLSSSEKKEIILMINVDSIIDGDNCYIFGGSFNNDGIIKNDWAAIQASEYAQDLGLEIYFQQPILIEMFIGLGITRGMSDYVPFNKAGITYIAFDAIKTNDDGMLIPMLLHSQYDDLDYLNNEFPGRVQKALREYSVLLEYVLLNLTIK